jgi:hypothetical protein
MRKTKWHSSIKKRRDCPSLMTDDFAGESATAAEGEAAHSVGYRRI